MPEEKKTAASQWSSPLDWSRRKDGRIRRYRKPGRPAIFPNGRKYLMAVFDLFEARQVHEFCLSQNIDVARFLRVAGLDMLRKQGVEVVETAVKQGRDEWNQVPANTETVSPSRASKAYRERNKDDDEET